ncbi:MAG: transcriptional repressor LexA [Alphaproteobacteria bacterium]|nr:transcriptional repressor LexA [Alphaproteobacteria bacterium]MCL2505704.1 transcriptional repressor LexA [Alphaproteobacteria bacterium]
MLTKKQKDLLVLIKSRLESEGIPPSFDEMKSAIGLKSKSGIHGLIKSLEERGFIKRLPYKARALEILKLPEGVEQPEKKVIKFNKSKPDFTSLPFYGRIAAGTPIEAIRNPDTIDVPLHMINPRKKCYALEVSGDSMIDAGILSGDRVVIQHCDNAEEGEIVVALVDENEVTLKFFHKEGAFIALKPANKSHEIRRLPSDRVRIQGKIVGLLRSY